MMKHRCSKCFSLGMGSVCASEWRCLWNEDAIEKYRDSLRWYGRHRERAPLYRPSSVMMTVCFAFFAENNGFCLLFRSKPEQLSMHCFSAKLEPLWIFYGAYPRWKRPDIWWTDRIRIQWEPEPHSLRLYGDAISINSKQRRSAQSVHIRPWHRASAGSESSISAKIGCFGGHWRRRGLQPLRGTECI